ncbi:MAG: LysM peptidoglycan-binding domain-containing protein, partial [Thiohalomonadales bacterium]
MTQLSNDVAISFFRQMMPRLTTFVFFVSLVAGLNQVHAGADPKLFPRPAGIDPAVKFWVKVFTEADTKSGYIHDDWNLDIIYEKLTLSKKHTRKQNRKKIKAVKKRYKQILSALARGKRKGLSKEEKRVLNLWPKGVSNATLRRAKKRLRFQLGQSNKFLAGLKRSGAWRTHILDNLNKMGLPTEIAALPHVESSFNPKAYSSVGAAGLWQFTRSTGRRFMRVDHVIDERMDPFKASIAAAQLLENNYAVTGTWPLAITAYNHGAGGMRNATRQVGSKDIDKIIKRYKSRSFKFASRNFYTAFLAVNDIQDDYEKYFGPVTVNPIVKDIIVTVPSFMPIKTLSKALGISKKELKRKNPALRPAVWNNTKYVPKGYALRISAGSTTSKPHKALLRVAKNERFSKQKPDSYHRVRRGQTLSTIAARYGVRVKDIAAINNIRRRNRIRVGQVLRLPQTGKHYASSTQLAMANNKKTSKTTRKHKLNKKGYYKVRRGDNIFKIAKRFGIEQKQLLALNNLNRRKPIYPGQMLLVKKSKAKERPKLSPADTTAVVVASIDTTKTNGSKKEIRHTAKTGSNTDMLDLISENIEENSSKTSGAKAARTPTKDAGKLLASHTPAAAESENIVSAE